MNNQLNYIEFSAPDLAAVKEFYTSVFAWEFTDWGDAYCSFSAASAGLDGGIEKGPGKNRGFLLILYADDLEACLAQVEQAGATISTPTFSFPGGRRFHFLDPAGNELAVWTDVDED